MLCGNWFTALPVTLSTARGGMILGGEGRTGFAEAPEVDRVDTGASPEQVRPRHPTP